MSYEKGLVSVVIPTYRRTHTLLRTVESVLFQTYRQIEVLIVNDNEPGDSYSKNLCKMLTCVTDTRVKLIEQERHINGAAARNAGIRVARGEFISFLDDDDTWEREKIMRQVKILSSLDESWGAVSCLIRTYKNGQLLKCSLPYKSGNILLDVLRRRTALGTGSLLIRREALDQSGYFDENLQRHQDLQLFAFLAEKYKIYLEPKYLYHMEIADVQNRPSAERLIEIKRAYFQSIAPVMEKLPEGEQRLIRALHSFEQAYAFFKEKNWKKAAIWTLAIVRSPKSLYLSIERIVKKTIEKKCKYYLEKKYSI